MEDTLTRYGATYQAKVVASLLADVKFLEIVDDIAKPDFFESDSNKWIVKQILEYFDEYRVCPTLQVFKLKVGDIVDKVLQQAIVDQLRTVFNHIEDSDLPFIKDGFLTFCKNQKIKEALIKSVDLLKAGEYEKIIDTMNNASKVGAVEDLGLNYIDNFESIIEDVKRAAVSTGWDVIDTLMDGGLGPGELGVIMAPSGVGKTWVLSKIVCAAIKRGLKVLHYTLELSENYVGQRYTTILTGIPTSDHKAKVDDIIEKIKHVTGRPQIKYYPPQFASSKTLAAHIQRMKLIGFDADLIVIDYADLLKSANGNRNDGAYQEMGGIYEELRGLSGEVGIPIWTASQTNRCFSLDTIVETPDGEIQIGKLKVGDKILTHDGYKTVSHIFPIERQPVYEITLKSGKKVKCSLRHQFPVKYGKLKSLESGLKVGDKLFTKKQK